MTGVGFGSGSTARGFGAGAGGGSALAIGAGSAFTGSGFGSLFGGAATGAVAIAEASVASPEFGELAVPSLPDARMVPWEVAFALASSGPAATGFLSSSDAIAVRRPM